MPGITSTALPSFSQDQHHETDAAKWKRALLAKTNNYRVGGSLE